MPDSFSVVQGGPLTLVVTLKDSDKVPITGYTGSEALSTTVWPGGNLAASFTAATSWVTPPATIQITITAAQTATLYPGVYELLTRLTDGGTPVDAYEATITVLPASGGIPPSSPPTIVSIAEAEAAVPDFARLSTADQMFLVADVTSALNNYCDRVFPLTTHDEYRPITRERVVRLKQYPIVTVFRVCTGLAVGLTVGNATLTRPTVTLTPSTDASDPAAAPVSLKLDGYSAGVAVVTTTLGFATYPTLGTLADAVNAVGNGWSAALGSTDYAPLNSADLNPDWGSKGASTATGQSSGGAYAGCPLLIYSHDVRRYDTYEQAGDIRIDDFVPPVLGGYGTGSFGYGRGYGSRLNPVRVTYSAGYNADPTAGPVTMPGSLRRAAFILIQIMFQKTAVGMKLSEKTQLQSMQYGYAKDLIRPNVSDLIEPFRRNQIY